MIYESMPISSLGKTWGSFFHLYPNLISSQKFCLIMIVLMFLKTSLTEAAFI